MTFLETRAWTDQQWSDFVDECFRNWLNRVDALVGYDERCQQPISEWRELFDDGESEEDAISIALWGMVG